MSRALGGAVALTQGVMDLHPIREQVPYEWMAWPCLPMLPGIQFLGLSHVWHWQKMVRLTLAGIPLRLSPLYY